MPPPLIYFLLAYAGHFLEMPDEYASILTLPAAFWSFLHLPFWQGLQRLGFQDVALAMRRRKNQYMLD